MRGSIQYLLVAKTRIKKKKTFLKIMHQHSYWSSWEADGRQRQNSPKTLGPADLEYTLYLQKE